MKLSLAARLLFLALLVLAPTAVPAENAPRLTGPPLGERWFSISMNNEWVGFNHTTVTKTADGYGLTSEGTATLKVMGTSRQAASRERYSVAPDLSLRSFDVDQIIEGKASRLHGEVSGKVAKVTTTTGGKTKTASLKFKKQLLPPPALNFYPPMQGAAPGRKYNVQMLDAEGVKVKGVEIEVIGVETLPGGEPSLHMQNDLYPIVSNDIWVDLAGNTIKESVREGLILTETQDPQAVLTFIAESALAKRDMILDYSLVRTEPPLKDPERLKGLTAAFSGFPSEFPLPQGPGQSATRSNDSVIVQMTQVPPKDANAPYDEAALARYLERSGSEADNGKIAAKAKEIAGDEQDRVKAAERLKGWVAMEIKRTATNFGPLEALERQEGGSRSHARLYVSMAKTVGIPTREVNGIVYVKGKGFLFHSWAECYLGSWVPVDPTFNQLPADVTHIKLVDGDSQKDLVLLGSVVGKLKGKILQQQY